MWVAFWPIIPIEFLLLLLPNGAGERLRVWIAENYISMLERIEDLLSLLFN